MQRVSKAYKQAMNKMIRDHSYMAVTVGIISSEAQSTATIISDMSYISDNKNLFKEIDVTNTYGTLEENLFKVDGSMIFPPENTGYQQLTSNIGAVSESILGGIKIEFEKAYDIKGVTINFGENYPTSFNIVLNDTTTFTYSNDAEKFVSEDSYNKTKTMTITPLAYENGNNKRLRINSILMGVGLVFQNEDIESASFSDSTSFISEELPQIDFSITCFDRYKRFNVDDSNSFINYLEIGQEILVSIGMELEDGATEWLTLPVTYLSVWSSDSMRVSFTSVDKFAFLTERYEDGNAIRTRTLYDDAIDVLTAAGLEADEYLVTDYLKTIEVTNPLPVSTQAECLQLIANAGRCVLKQDAEGRITINPNFENITEPDEMEIVTTTQAAWSIPDNIRQGAEVVYADLTNDFFETDGTMVFMPNNSADYEGTGYVSEQISIFNGYFYTNLLFPNSHIDESFQFTPQSPLYHEEYIWQNHLLTKGTYLLNYGGTIYDDINQHLVIDILNESNGEQIVDSITTDSDSGYEYFTIEDDVYCNAYIRLESFGSDIYSTYSLHPSLISMDEVNIPVDYVLEKHIFWGTKPKLSFELPTEYTFYGINLLFANPIMAFYIRTYDDDVLQDEVLIQADDYDNGIGQTLFEVVYAFYSFDKMEFEILQTEKPYQRAVLQQISFGRLSEYTLRKEDMLENPIGTVEQKTQSVSVKVFEFETDAQTGLPKEIDNEEYYTYTVGTIGENITFENQLISTQEQAAEVARWIANYYANNITYEVSYRGEPRIESADYIFMDSDIINNLQVDVESHSLSFSGTLSGTLNLRRAANMVSG